LNQGQSGEGGVVPYQHDFQGKAVRTVLNDGQVWFVARDVCDILEHSNSRMALQRLEEVEKGVSSVYTPGGAQEVAIVSESGLYALIFSSRKPKAKTFRRWVTNEVLPSLRRSGSGEPEPLAAGEVYVRVASPGSYLVIAAPGSPTRVERNPFRTTGRDLNAGDLRALSLTVGAIACLWRRYWDLTDSGMPTQDGFSRHTLEALLLQAEDMAQHYLRFAQRDAEVTATAAQH
jgi:hypothetical protein